MSKLIIEINFEDIHRNEKQDIDFRMTEVIQDEFIYYGNEYPKATINSFWRDDE